MNSDIDRRLNDLYDELVHLLTPFGWVVEREEGMANFMERYKENDYRTTFRMKYAVNCPEHMLHQQRLEMSFHVDHLEARYSKDDKYWEWLAHDWARETLLKSLEIVNKTRLNAGEVDWRPNEMIPEDFYA
jgi:hypothetical protein